MKPVSVYPEEILPQGFKYPARFTEMASANEKQDLYPWIFIDTQSEAGELLFSLRMRDGRNLVPFATLENGDGDTACFDGNDTAGNPAVLMLVLDDSGRSYAYADFDSWLKAAETDALRWKGR